LKTKSSPLSLSTGILWADGKTIYNQNFRHSVRQDELTHFEWQRNDGLTFGIESLIDEKADANISASYIIHPTSPTGGGGWTQHFQITKQRLTPLPFLFYYGLECDTNPSRGSSSTSGRNKEKKPKSCFKKGTLSQLEIISSATQKLSPEDITQPGSSNSSNSPAYLSETTMTHLVVIGFSELTNEWFTLTLTGLSVDLTDDDKEYLTDHEGIKSLDLSLQLSSGLWAPTAITGMQAVVDEILRSGEVNRQRAMEVSQANFKITQETAGTEGPEHVKKQQQKKETHEGYIFNPQTMMIPAAQIDSEAIGIVSQFMSRTSFEVTVDYQTNPLWQTREDVVKGVAADNLAHAFLEKRREYWKALRDKVALFEDNFHNRFSLKTSRGGVRSDTETERERVEGELSDDEIAMRCLSNLLGGLGYFHGTSTIGNSEEYNSLVEALKKKMSPEEKRRSLETDPRYHIPLTLFSATPSRSSFPRGFLWDEGFHQLLINRWDPSITMEVITQWLESMLHHSPPLLDNTTTPLSCPGGWIPREMILGEAANRVVPTEFVTQRVDIANPPTLLLAVNDLLDQYDKIDLLHTQCEATPEGSQCTVSSSTSALQGQLFSFFLTSFPRLDEWMTWFLASQSTGPDGIIGSFRWRGRKFDPNRLMTNTLASGLDDYPRGSMPSPREYHLDLLCWVISSLKIMNRLQHTILTHHLRHTPSPNNDSLRDHNTLLQQLQHNSNYTLSRIEFYSEQLVTLHWSESRQGFYDVGLIGRDETLQLEYSIHCVVGKGRRGLTQLQVTEEKLEQAKERNDLNSLCPQTFPQFAGLQGDARGSGQPALKRVYLTSQPHELTFIPRIGYVNLFPFLLQILSPDSTHLPWVLSVIESPNHLWTPHGLRSISKTDLFYQIENAPGDAPYWRCVGRLLVCRNCCVASLTLLLLCLTGGQSGCRSTT
jgi:hypothetical protein